MMPHILMDEAHWEVVIGSINAWSFGYAGVGTNTWFDYLAGWNGHLPDKPRQLLLYNHKQWVNGDPPLRLEYTFKMDYTQGKAETGIVIFNNADPCKYYEIGVGQNGYVFIWKKVLGQELHEYDGIIQAISGITFQTGKYYRLSVEILASNMFTVKINDEEQLGGMWVDGISLNLVGISGYIGLFMGNDTSMVAKNLYVSGTEIVIPNNNIVSTMQQCGTDTTTTTTTAMPNTTATSTSEPTMTLNTTTPTTDLPTISPSVSATLPPTFRPGWPWATEQPTSAPTESYECSISLSAHGDDTMNVYISRDYGITWNLTYAPAGNVGNHWRSPSGSPYNLSVTDIDINTR